ncbi:MAG: NADH-quinone oxidoreductase subunit A [Candidatus Bathyarchaeia archaeon]
MVQTPDVLGLGVYVLIMVIFPLSLVLAGKVLGPSNPNPKKNMTFECGHPPEGSAHTRFTIQYYPYAMIYAIFGAMAVFLLLTAPALTAIARMGGDAAGVILAFVAILALALVSAVISLRSVRCKIWG